MGSALGRNMYKPFGVEDVTQAQVDTWEEKYGEYWADNIAPESRTTIWDFDTEADARKFLIGGVPSGYFARLFKRVNVRPGPEGIGLEWDEVEINLWESS
jgi:hypothetical protein